MANLQVEFAGMELLNPLMSAAGPNGRTGEQLLEVARGGAGGMVMKTISLEPAPVPYPNIFRMPGENLLNCELWSDLPYERYLEHEYPLARKAGIPLIAGLGYSGIELEKLGPLIEQTGCVDALEFSLHFLGRDLEAVTEAARALKNAVNLPILAKISPDFPDLQGLVRALEPFIDGFVAVNALGPGLDFDPETRKPYLGSENGLGWLSGKFLLPVTLRIVFELSQWTQRPIIAAGGVTTGLDAIKLMMAGASAVQVCSAAIIHGNAIYGRIARQMNQWLDDHGYTNVSQIIGLYAKDKHPLQVKPGKVVCNRAQCIRCHRCIHGCIHHAIQPDSQNFPVHTQRCISCGYCVSVCPSGALSIETLS